MRDSGIRGLLVLHLAGVAATSSALVLALGLPLLARGRGGATLFLVLVVGAAAASVALGAAFLFRAVARPVDRLLAAGERLGEGAVGTLPPLGASGTFGLARGAVAFERVAAALGEERAQLAAKVAELTHANRALADARDSLVRSEKLATVGRLAAGVAHEVGNPLGAIAGYAELARTRVRERRGEAEVDEYLGRIVAEAARIDAIVRDLLDFARATPPVVLPVDLAPVVEGAVRLGRMQARLRDVEVVLDLGDAPWRVLADERRLAQVFLNLLLNAGDAMGGRGRVRIAARPAEGAAPRVEVLVEDSGPGIAPEHLARIFDPFFTTKAPGEGTGLGLAVCHGILASLGGAISAANGEGGGAVFRLELPLAPRAREGGAA
jgi:signal transduction histidine kinase